MVVQGAIKRYNFFIDPETLQVSIVGFTCINALPRSFVGFMLHTTRDKFIAGSQSPWTGNPPITLLRRGRLQECAA